MHLTSCQPRLYSFSARDWLRPHPIYRSFALKRIHVCSLSYRAGALSPPCRSFPCPAPRRWVCQSVLSSTAGASSCPPLWLPLLSRKTIANCAYSHPPAEPAAVGARPSHGRKRPPGGGLQGHGHALVRLVLFFTPSPPTSGSLRSAGKWSIQHDTRSREKLPVFQVMRVIPVFVSQRRVGPRALVVNPGWKVDGLGGTAKVRRPLKLDWVPAQPARACTFSAFHSSCTSMACPAIASMDAGNGRSRWVGCLLHSRPVIGQSGVFSKAMHHDACHPTSAWGEGRTAASIGKGSAEDMRTYASVAWNEAAPPLAGATSPARALSRRPDWEVGLCMACSPGSRTQYSRSTVCPSSSYPRSRRIEISNRPSAYGWRLNRVLADRRVSDRPNGTGPAPRNAPCSLCRDAFRGTSYSAPRKSVVALDHTRGARAFDCSHSGLSSRRASKKGTRQYTASAGRCWMT